MSASPPPIQVKIERGWRLGRFSNVASREMWACVRRLTGKQKNVGRVEGITA